MVTVTKMEFKVVSNTITLIIVVYVIKFVRSVVFSRYNVLEYKKSLKIPKGGNQKTYIEEQTTQWPKEKVQKDKQRSTKHTNKTKDQVT